MKLAIIGGRDFTDYIRLCNEADALRPEHIISGGARGADALARKYARSKRIGFTEFLPDYEQYNRKAPLIRNMKIVESADIVLAFWNGKSLGTKHAISYAQSLKIQIIVVMY